MSLNTKDLTVLNAHTKYKGNTKTAHLFHKQMLATLSKSNQKISRFIHSGLPGLNQTIYAPSAPASSHGGLSAESNHRRSRPAAP